MGTDANAPRYFDKRTPVEHPPFTIGLHPEDALALAMLMEQARDDRDLPIFVQHSEGQYDDVDGMRYLEWTDSFGNAVRVHIVAPDRSRE